MAVGTKPDNRQDSGHNPARNPGDMWQERLNAVATKEREGNFDDIVANGLSDVDVAGDKIINDNADRPKSSAEKINDLESAPQQYVNNVSKPQPRQKQSMSERIVGLFKSKKAPSIVTGILFGNGAALTILIGAPSTMFADIVSTATNENNFSAPTKTVRGLKMWSHRIAGGPNSDKVKANCSAPDSIKCKSVTFSERQVNELKDADIDSKTNGKDVQDKDNKDSKVGDRYAVEEIDVPTGDLDDKGNPVKEKIKAGEDIETKLTNKPRLRTMLYKGFNPLTKSFFGSHFNDILAKSFKTNRGDKLTGEDEKGERESMRQSLDVEGVKGDENGRASSEEREKSKAGRLEKIKALGTKFTGKGTNALGTACSVYNGARVVTAAAKAQKIVLLTRLFIVYASEMHRIMDGTSQPQHATFIGDNWNYSENEGDTATNRYYKTTASDAEGMKMIFHGELLDLLPWSQKYMVGGNAALYTMDRSIKTLQDNFPGGKKGLKTACKIGSSGLICVGPQAAICLASAAAMAAAGPLLAKGIEPLIKFAVNELDNLDIDDDTKGVELGNAFAAGAGLALGREAQEVGLRPSNKTNMQTYRKVAAETNNQTAMMYRDQAKSTPFDASNQYSFLGTIAHSIYQHGGTSATILGNISRSLSVIPASISTLVQGSSAHAAMLMDQNDFQPEQWSKCPDPALQDMNVDGSPYCTPGFDMSTNALNMDIDANQRFMIDGGYADSNSGAPTGKADMGGGGFVGSIDSLLGGAIADVKDPADSDKGHKFAMYKKYCANRDQDSEGPYGETTDNIESGSSADEKWKTGYYCLNAVDNPKASAASATGKNTVSLISTSANSNNTQLAASSDSGNDGPTQEELDNFATFTTDYGDMGTATLMDEGSQSTAKPTGDCSQLAQQLLDSPNVKFQVEPQQRTYMEQTARDCTQTLDCGGSTQMSTKLLALLVKASESYKITIGAQAAGHECDGGYHPVGQAIDINGVRKADQDFEQSTNWSADDRQIFKEFYEFLDQNSDVKLELGQMTDTCWQGSPMPTLHNTKPVPDVCNHIHVGVTSP